MNPLLIERIKEDTPHIDERIGLGLSYHDNPNIPLYVDRLFRINSKRFPKKLKYLGCEKVPPKEGYQYMTRISNNNTRKYDINKNDIRLYAFNFDFDGQPIRKYIYLPFIRRHGFMWMNGVKYMVAPVMADGIITIKPTEIFVKLIKIKLWFERIRSVNIFVDGVSEYTSIYHSKIHNKKDTGRTDNFIKMKCTLVHYLCCKFGMTKTLEMFGFKPGSVQMLNEDDFETAADLSNQYPTEDWVIVKSNGRKPPHSYLYPYYEPTKMFFAVRRHEWETIRSAKTVIGTLIYVLSHYTRYNRMNPDIVDNTEAWRSMMGEAICSTSDHASIIQDNIDKHMVSLDGYVDDMTIDDFERIGLGHIDSIYKLFVYIVENFIDLTSEISQISKSNTLYGKQLQICQFLLFDLTKAINNAYFNLSTLRLEEDRNPNVPVKYEAVRKAIESIRAEVVMQIKNHTEIIVVDDPADLPILKMGRIVIPQEKSDKARTSNTQFNVEDPSVALHESLLECGAAFDMSKADPSGRSRLNPYVTITDDYTIVPNPDLADKIEAVKKLLYGEVDNRHDIEDTE